VPKAATYIPLASAVTSQTTQHLDPRLPLGSSGQLLPYEDFLTDTLGLPALDDPVPKGRGIRLLPAYAVLSSVTDPVF